MKRIAFYCAELALKGAAVFSLSLLLFLSLSLSPLMTGCKTTPDTAAYKAASATHLGAEEALRLWDVYLQTQRQAGHPVSLEDELRVKKSYDHYRTASYLVIDAGRAYTRARALGNDATAADLYQSALKSAAEAKTDLFNLLQSLGLKLIPTN